MIYNFNTYNESLRDKMKPRTEFHGTAKKVFDVMEICNNAGFQTRFDESLFRVGGVGFSIYNYKHDEDLYGNVYYHEGKGRWDLEKDKIIGWQVDINKNSRNLKSEFFGEDWDKSFKFIIESFYGDIDEVINTTKSEIEKKTELLKGFEYAKKQMNKDD